MSSGWKAFTEQFRAGMTLEQALSVEQTALERSDLGARRSGFP
jgi:hypothetical protein